MTPQERKVTRLFNAGKTDAEIAAALKLSKSRIQDIRLSLGLKRPGAGRTPLDVEFILREWDAGDHDTESIARKLGKGHPDSIRRILRHARPSKKMTRRIPEEDWSRAREMLEDGMPYAQVAQEVGIYVGHLRKKLPGLGVRPKDHWAYIQARHLEEKVFA